MFILEKWQLRAEIIAINTFLNEDYKVGTNRSPSRTGNHNLRLEEIHLEMHKGYLKVRASRNVELPSQIVAAGSVEELKKKLK